MNIFSWCFNVFWVNFFEAVLQASIEKNKTSNNFGESPAHSMSSKIMSHLILQKKSMFNRFLTGSNGIMLLFYEKCRCLLRLHFFKVWTRFNRFPDFLHDKYLNEKNKILNACVMLFKLFELENCMHLVLF